MDLIANIPPDTQALLIKTATGAALMAGGFVLKVGWDFGVGMLKVRQARKAEQRKSAQAALEQAKQTPSKEDDVVAQATLARVELEETVIAQLTASLEKNRPGTASAVPAAPVAPAPPSAETKTS